MENQGNDNVLYTVFHEHSHDGSYFFNRQILKFQIFGQHNDFIEKMKKNVLVGPLKQFEHCQHTKMHLSGVKAHYLAKMVLFPDGVSFQLFSFPRCRSISKISRKQNAFRPHHFKQLRGNVH